VELAVMIIQSFP